MNKKFSKESLEKFYMLLLCCLQYVFFSNLVLNYCTMTFVGFNHKKFKKYQNCNSFHCCKKIKTCSNLFCSFQRKKTHGTTQSCFELIMHFSLNLNLLWLHQQTEIKFKWLTKLLNGDYIRIIRFWWAFPKMVKYPLELFALCKSWGLFCYGKTIPPSQEAEQTINFQAWVEWPCWGNCSLLNRI